MKQLTSKLWAKIAALILLSVFAVAAVLSIISIAFLVSEDAYTKSPETILRERINYNEFSRCMSLAERYCELFLEDDLDNGDASYVESHFSPENSNFFFIVKDTDGKTLYESPGAGVAYRYESTWTYPIAYNWREVTETCSFADTQAYNDYQDMLNEQNFHVLNATAVEDEDGAVSAIITHQQFDSKTLLITGYIREVLSAQDEFYTQQVLISWLLSMRNWCIVIALGTLLVCLVLFIYLLCAAGHKAGVDGISLNWLDRIPYDLYLATDAALVICIFLFFGDAFNDSQVSVAIIAVSVCVFLCVPLVMGFLMTSATRFKLGKWWQNTVIYKLLRLVKRIAFAVGRGLRTFFRALSVIWQLVLLWCGYCLIELILVIGAASSYDAGGWIGLWLLFYLALSVGVVMLSIQLRKIQMGGKALADGNLDYTVDTKHMHLALRQHAENLNSIANGMQKAVASQMRSERFRTELITNVSHDIKTPLTSIVNYVDLLKKEDVQPEKAREYIEVLDRQSARLKKLTVDLVEASKASTGALPVSLEPTDVNVLLGQVAGEYLDRLEAAGLEPVFKPDPSAPKIMADGKLIWRVLDNLLSNVCKYAMPGTRMYFASEVTGGKVVITFRNISKYALDISADELMERFVRGDRSRSTEGSGLGLSIAQSLTQLQKGEFKLSIDGDLFKAIVTFDEFKE